MAIVKGLEPGAVLFKFIEEGYEYRRNPKTGRHERVLVEQYYVLELYSRRNRTNGFWISATKNQDRWIPFLEKLKIRLLERGIEYHTGKPYYVAVGCSSRRIRSKEEWEQIEISPIAKNHYDKIKNEHLLVLLEQDPMIISSKKLEYMKALLELREEPPAEVEEEERWPAPPGNYEFQGFNINDIGRIPLRIRR